MTYRRPYYQLLQETYLKGCLERPNIQDCLLVNLQQSTSTCTSTGNYAVGTCASSFDICIGSSINLCYIYTKKQLFGPTYVITKLVNI